MWLPISLRIKAKALTIVYKALCKLPPSLLPPVSYPKTFYLLIFPPTLSSLFLQYIRHVSLRTFALSFGPRGILFLLVPTQLKLSFLYVSVQISHYHKGLPLRTIQMYPTTISHLSCCIFLTQFTIEYVIYLCLLSPRMKALCNMLGKYSLNERIFAYKNIHKKIAKYCNSQEEMAYGSTSTCFLKEQQDYKSSPAVTNIMENWIIPNR